MKITITNHLLLSDIPENIKEILTERLKFSNPKWLENQRMHRWNDDTPKLLKFYTEVRQGLVIPRGYARQLILLCRHHDVSYEIEDRRRVLAEADFKFNGELKSFQEKAVRVMLSKEFGTLTAPTASGKTVMALYMIAQRRQPALIVTHTKELAFQWVNRIGDFLGIPEKDVGFIGGGKKNIGEKITVALVQTLYKCANEVAKHIGYLIVDECHRAPSRTFTEAVTAFDSKYMLGLSATPWRRDKLSVLIFWHLGDVHHEVDNSSLVEKGDILQAEAIIRETDFRPYYDPVREYSKMLSELTADDQRNQLIASDVAREAKQSQGVLLVLSDRKKHCETLQSLLKYKFKVSADLLTGDLSNSQRRAVLDRLNKGEVKVLIATGQLVGEGFDCKDLSTLFIATPIRFSGRVVQYLGRILRAAPGKKKARVFDYVDSHVGPLKAAAKARQFVYQRDRLS
ncbi:DEAD/DEAH box helicase [Desulfonema magnum]|uniref:Helicase/UvrB domain-containing protein n=1 Tax=Desulfonema magnum TaxID=45655 RepID=A0A975BP98_9BACT|nr:DEAD/DEAH box helicase [Desulfonema magnum]QTA88674.1 Helicase/UvrB domain-containing protein [Desulfonema magnum]